MDMNQFEKALNEDSHVYLNGRLTHAGWVGSMQYRYLAQCVEKGKVLKAELTDVWKQVNWEVGL